MAPSSIIVDQRDWNEAAQIRSNVKKLARRPQNDEFIVPVSEKSASLKEGAYFIGDDDVLFRHFKDGDRLVMAPKNSPIVPENKVADTSKKLDRYKRIMLLIRMRDTVKTILHLQEEYSDEVVIQSMSEAPWAKAQEQLKELYKTFTHNFGPINKYEWRKAGQLDEDGNRSDYKMRTNLKKFRKDPDAYLVASIEDFDEETQEASLGNIAYKRVLRARSGQPIIQDVKQALTYCLDEKSAFDLSFIQEMLPDKSQGEILDELKQKKLIYFDSAQSSYVAKEEFLSGNLHQKLEQAEEGSDEEKALKRALPKRLKPEDINITLGMPWIPKDIIEQFAEEELGLTDVEINYLPHAHTWFLQSAVSDKILAEYEYGTEIVKSNELLERALNKLEAAFQKQTDSAGQPLDREKEKNLAETRMEKIEERFQDWIWENKQRAKLIQGLYNEQYNSVEPRKFDGSHISFAGSSVAIDLRPHQKNGVARDLNSPTTLLEWDVGAGKTFGAIAALMEGQRHDKFEKPMMVVQNHLLGEFSRDFMKLYPNANILVVEEDQLVDHGEKVTSAEKMQKLVDKVSQHDWDAVIITKSTFDRIHISPERKIQQILKKIESLQKQNEEVKEHLTNNSQIAVQHWGITTYIKEQIYDQKIAIAKYLGIDKAFEKEGQPYYAQIQKAVSYLDEFISEDLSSPLWQEAIQARRAENPAFFEDLGVDKLYVDEVHDYKNLTIRSRIPDVAKTGSTKADSFKEKLDYLREVNPENYLTMLTATPVLNSLMEFYVFQQYLQPDLLEEYGLEHPDAWISMFGEIVEDIELAPETGYYRSVKRLSAYKNIPELMRFYRSCSDVVTRDDLDMELPELVNEKGEITGKPQIIEVPESPQLKEFFQKLLKRAVRVRAGKVSPSEDNILKIINEARLATLDPRLVGLERDFDIETKVDRSAKEIAKRYNANKDRVYHTENKDKELIEDPVTGSLQMVLCNQGIPKGDGTFSTYEDLKERLIEQGVPANQIAFIHDHDSDKKKEELFNKCRNGEISVLVGTTQKLGTGTNVQKRLIALHELDAPWRPGDVIQGRGRIDRQKNQNPFIEILTYIQEGSFDIYNWQMLERKARFIAQAKIGASNRTFEDDDAFTLFCESAKNTAANDDLLADKALISKELTPLQLARKSMQNERKRSKSRLKLVRQEIKDLKKQIDSLKAEQKNFENATFSDKPFDIDGHKFRRSIRAGKHLKKQLRNVRQILKDTLDGGTTSKFQGNIGRFFGFDMDVKADLNVIEKPSPSDDSKTTREYKYSFSIVVDTPEPTEIPIPMDDIQESRLEKEFEKSAGDHEALQKVFGDNAQIREKRRELTGSFNRIIERIASPFISINDELIKARAELAEYKEEEEKLSVIVENKFSLEGRYQYLLRRSRDIDKKLLEVQDSDNDNYDPADVLHDYDVA